MKQELVFTTDIAKVNQLGSKSLVKHIRDTRVSLLILAKEHGLMTDGRFIFKGTQSDIDEANKLPAEGKPPKFDGIFELNSERDYVTAEVVGSAVSPGTLDTNDDLNLKGLYLLEGGNVQAVISVVRYTTVMKRYPKATVLIDSQKPWEHKIGFKVNGDLVAALMPVGMEPSDYKFTGPDKTQTEGYIDVIRNTDNVEDENVTIEPVMFSGKTLTPQRIL